MILAFYGIRINDPDNLVQVDAAWHQYMHTTMYHYFVGLLIESASLGGKEQVVATLKYINDLISSKNEILGGVA